MIHESYLVPSLQTKVMHELLTDFVQLTVSLVATRISVSTCCRETVTFDLTETSLAFTSTVMAVKMPNNNNVQISKYQIFRLAMKIYLLISLNNSFLSGLFRLE